jgi:hypothetical protein
MYTIYFLSDLEDLHPLWGILLINLVAIQFFFFHKSEVFKIV